MGPDTFTSRSSQLTTLYWQAVTSLCRRPGREEQRCDLTVRILQGADGLGSSTRVGKSKFLRLYWQSSFTFIKRTRQCMPVYAAETYRDE